MSEIRYEINPSISNEALNELFDASWPGHVASGFLRMLSHSLVYIGAWHEERLIGFVNVAWDGGIHAFLLDTTVHPEFRRRGIGKQLVLHAATAAKVRGIHWLHVDYEPHLEHFYQQECGFRDTKAGLMRLLDI